jgi:hypothetical protein
MEIEFSDNLETETNEEEKLTSKLMQKIQSFFNQGKVMR